jgi:hypothetical protein
MSERFTIRLATPEDVDAIAEQRARMFDEMGQVPSGSFELLRAKSRERLRDLLTRGGYIGWLAVPTQRPDIIAGGAGVQIREVLPHPLPRANVLLLQRIIDWARAEQLDRLVLHASEAGRSLYERLGFVGTNEMRWAGE